MLWQHSVPNSLTDPRQIGARAERAAERYLRWRGWRICARNWVGGGGELDIVASLWRTLLVVEVRHRPEHGQAAASIDAEKLARTRKATRALIRLHGLQDYRLRLDVFLYDAAERLERRTVPI